MKIIILAIISLAFSPTFIGVNSRQQTADPFVDVPPSQREQLKSRLNEFIEYHRTKQWNKVFDLFGEQYKSAIDGGLSRENFLKKRLYSSIRKFTPKSVQKMDDNQWVIRGCGTFDQDRGVESAAEAYFKDDNWYFSDIWSAPPCVNCRPKSCKH